MPVNLQKSHSPTPASCLLVLQVEHTGPNVLRTSGVVAEAGSSISLNPQFKDHIFSEPKRGGRGPPPQLNQEREETGLVTSYKRTHLPCTYLSLTPKGDPVPLTPQG